VLDSHSSIQADLDALEAAQEACAAAARECAKQQPVHNNSSSSSSSRPQAPEMVQLRHQLDKAYLAACKANEWREMTEVCFGWLAVGMCRACLPARPPRLNKNSTPLAA
jgi:hypothetical protein